MNKYEKAANELFKHIPQAGGADCQTTNRFSAMCEAYRLLIEASNEVGCDVPFDSGFAPSGYLVQAIKSGVCIWSQDEAGDMWSADCGDAWTFVDDGPLENNVRFCPFCGRKVVANGYCEGDG